MLVPSSSNHNGQEQAEGSKEESCEGQQVQSTMIFLTPSEQMVKTRTRTPSHERRPWVLNPEPHSKDKAGSGERQLHGYLHVPPWKERGRKRNTKWEKRDLGLKKST